MDQDRPSFQHVPLENAGGQTECKAGTLVPSMDYMDIKQEVDQAEFGPDEGMDIMEKERPLRRKRRVKGQKICGVCGDLAQSHNFGALTCETCKAFFRRNAFKQKELQNCVFNNGCIITKTTRRFCAPCRLKKCYTIGMDPELILDEEEKKARQKKRERSGSLSGRGQQERMGQTDLSAITSSTNVLSPAVQSPNSTSTATTPSPKTPASDTSSDSKDPGLTECSGSFDYPDKGKWRRPRNAQGRSFKHVTREELPWDMQLYWPLSLEERTLLTCLTSTYQSVTTVSSHDQEHMNTLGSFCMDKAILALEFSMRQYVRFARAIPEFQLLRQCDKIAVLKASALQWYHVRQASEFIPERRAWLSVCGTMGEKELGDFFGDSNGVREYADFCEGLKSVVKNDFTLYALIHALLLFDARDPNIEDRICINQTKDKYLLLLKHHLESQFSFLHADRYLAEVMEQIMDLRQLGESSLTFYKHFSSQFRPLIAEVFSD